MTGQGGDLELGATRRSRRRDVTVWGRVRALFGRCPADRFVPGDLGRPVRVYCDRGRHELGWHAWRSRVWLADGQSRPELP